MTNLELFRAERDALGLLGIIAHSYLTWDPPIHAGKDSAGRDDFTHFLGLNIHALIIDNIDGEVLALERNLIHEHESPVFHAEQAAVRAANERLRVKRSREPGTSVESYYRSKLFYDQGTTDDDWVRKGATLYSTLEPCPMCAATLLVCRMKRVVFAIPDQKYGGAWGSQAAPGLKDKFYPSYELRYEPLSLAAGSPLLDKTKPFFDGLMARVAELRKFSLQDTWFLDRMHTEIASALDILTALKDTDVSTNGADRATNLKTLSDLKRICRLPE